MRKGVSLGTLALGLHRHTVHFGARVKDLARVVCESRQMYAVLLAGNRLGGFALLDIEDLDGFVVAGRDHVVALIVEIQGGHEVGGVLLGGFVGLEPRYSQRLGH